MTGNGSPLSVPVSTTASCTDHGAVDGHDLPGAHNHDVSRLNLADRHLLEPISDA